MRAEAHDSLQCLYWLNIVVDVCETSRAENLWLVINSDASHRYNQVKRHNKTHHVAARVSPAAVSLLSGELWRLQLSGHKYQAGGWVLPCC